MLLEEREEEGVEVAPPTNGSPPPHLETLVFLVDDFSFPATAGTPSVDAHGAGAADMFGWCGRSVCDLRVRATCSLFAVCVVVGVRVVRFARRVGRDLFCC